MSRHREEDPHMNFNTLKVKDIKIIDMDLGGRAIAHLRVKTTRCDDTCSKYNLNNFCPSRRWIHETKKLYKRRMYIGKRKYPVCLLRREVAKTTGCLRKDNIIGPRQHRTLDAPTF